MRAKALGNLDAAERLRRVGLLDAAANRLYYAAYQAAWHALRRRGVAPGQLGGERERAENRFLHSTVIQNASLIRGDRADGRLLSALRSLRVQADYSSVPVEKETLAARWQQAASLVALATKDAAHE